MAEILDRTQQKVGQHNIPEQPKSCLTATHKNFKSELPTSMLCIYIYTYEVARAGKQHTGFSDLWEKGGART